VIRSGWNRFLFEERDGLPLAVVRVCVAGLILVWAVSLAPGIGRYFTDGGEFPIGGARAWSPEFVARWLMPDALGGPAATSVLLLVLVVGAGFLLAGSWTRTSAGLTWLLVTWFQLRNPAVLDGGDELLRLAAFYVCFAYLGLGPERRSFTVDRLRLRHRRGMSPSTPAALVPAWTLRLFQLQLVVLSGASGLSKLAGAGWWDGSAVAYALGNPSLSRFGLVAPLRIQAVAALVGIAVMTWELLFPLLVWHPRLRRSVLVAGVLLNGAILVTLDLGLFPLAVLALYPCFLTGPELRRAADALARVAFPGRRRAPGWGGTAGTPAPPLGS
jgi:hypothetical protein